MGAVVAFSLAAWAPVFAGLQEAMGPEVFGSIYPDWRSAQAAAVEAVCRDPEHTVSVADVHGRPAGFAAVCFVDEGDARAGEISMVAVDPAHQRSGLATALVAWAVAEIGARGAGLAVIATGGDPGHAPARALYERLGFAGLLQVRSYRRL